MTSVFNSCILKAIYVLSNEMQLLLSLDYGPRRIDPLPFLGANSLSSCLVSAVEDEWSSRCGMSHELESAIMDLKIHQEEQHSIWRELAETHGILVHASAVWAARHSSSVPNIASQSSQTVSSDEEWRQWEKMKREHDMLVAQWRHDRESQARIDIRPALEEGRQGSDGQSTTQSEHEQSNLRATNKSFDELDQNNDGIIDRNEWNNR